MGTNTQRIVQNPYYKVELQRAHLQNARGDGYDIAIQLKCYKTVPPYSTGQPWKDWELMSLEYIEFPNDNEPDWDHIVPDVQRGLHFQLRKNAATTRFINRVISTLRNSQDLIA